MNKDLKSLLHWLNGNKISLHVTKTEVAIFRAESKVFDTDLKLKMCGKKLYPSHHVKYLGACSDEYFNWETHVNQLYVILVRAMPCSQKFNILLMKPLQSINFAIFNSHLLNECTAWGQFIVSSHRVCEKCFTYNLRF